MPTPSSRSFWVPSLAIPAVRAVRKEDDRRSYSLPPASTDHDSAHHWSDAFSASRMRTLLGPSRASKSLHRTVSISDTLTVGPQARPSRSPYRPMRCPYRPRSLPRDRYEASPACPRIPYHPAGKSLMVGNPRAPSVVSRVCKPKPAGRIHVDLIGAVNPRTDSPSVHHRSTSFLGALWLLPG
jgi:hypothetical protein